VTIQRAYSLTFLAALQSNKVEADFTVSNDARIQLTDASSKNLNVTTPIVIVTTVSNKDFSRPPIVIQETSPPSRCRSQGCGPHGKSTPFLPVPFNRLQDIGFRPDRCPSRLTRSCTSWPSDRMAKKGRGVLLSVSDLRNLSALLERFEEKRKSPAACTACISKSRVCRRNWCSKFRKTGNTIGDPVREPGRGTNPLEGQQPAPPAQQQNPQDQNMGQWASALILA